MNFFRESLHKNTVKLERSDFLKTIVLEIKPENVLAQNIIENIVYSKRLLVDHVELLENCLPVLEMKIEENEAQLKNIFSIRNTCIVVAGSILQTIFMPKMMRFAALPLLVSAGAFTTATITKTIMNLQNKFVIKNIQSLTNCLDEFGNCIKRNINYFNEILVMKSDDLIESRQIERAWDCITSAKGVIEILYDATRKLEDTYVLNGKLLICYSPMEELRDSEYFEKNITDYTPKNIKDFYNIYAYVQSQYLLRLALTTIEYPSNSYVRNEIVTIKDLIKEHINDEDSHFKKISLDLKRKQQIELDELKNMQNIQKRSGPVAVLQDSSLRLNSCMLAVADQCQQLDNALHRLNTDFISKPSDEGKYLMEVANNMRLIESSLSVCCDDFQRLFLVYNRFLSSKLGSKSNNKVSITQTSLNDSGNSILEENILTVEITDENKTDDFFACTLDNLDNYTIENVSKNSELDCEDEKLTKACFKPVLRQLKAKIDPIRVDMLKKEREVLKLKGVDVDNLFGNDCCSDSEGSGDEADLLSIQKYKSRKDFDEMRDFMASKLPVNFFDPSSISKNVCGSETILE